MNKKNLIYAFISLLLYSCSGSTGPSFEYIDNTRIVLEGYIVNQNGTPSINQKIILSNRNLSNILTVFTDTSGRFFLSTPQANYAYSLNVGEFSIISSERFSNLLKSDPQDLPNLIPLYENITGLYYNFGLIKIKKP